jgi:hypothetical protein
MARAIFGTYPEIDKKCIFLKIAIVKFFSDLGFFLEENTLVTFITIGFKNRLLRKMGRRQKWTLKVRKNRFFSEKLNNFRNRKAR